MSERARSFVIGSAIVIMTVALLLLVIPPGTVLAQEGVLFVENGNVGITEANPGFPLHIVRQDGTAAVVVEERSTTVQNRSLFTLINNGGAEFGLQNSNSGQNWRFHTGGGRFNISLVGTGADELRLTQTGNLIISGSLTTAGGFYPDYVFSDSYKLMPLSDLRHFIDEHRHLPNVPTALETEGGREVNMTELQLRLLEKVEELTLYVLQQEEHIQEQQRRITAFQEELDELRAKP